MGLLILIGVLTVSAFLVWATKGILFWTVDTIGAFVAMAHFGPWAGFAWIFGFIIFCGILDSLKIINMDKWEGL